MISIIVPVFNVEPYLRQCIDSILAQTYKDIEVLLIDDGSPDKCAEICDEYKSKDNRVRVFHTENRGLSAARNLGLQEAAGEYIGFVDSDDWLEPDMYKTLLNTLEKNDAGIGICGYWYDYPNYRVIANSESFLLSSYEATRALIRGIITTVVWNKLYRKDLFDNVHFPDGHVYEDIPILYLLFLESTAVVSIPHVLYHNRQRKGSISHTHTAKSLIDIWVAHRDRYSIFLNDKRFKNDYETMNQLLLWCAKSISKIWRSIYGSGEYSKFYDELEEMSQFVREHYPPFGMKDWPIAVRFGVFMARKMNKVSLFIAYYANQFFRLFQNKEKLY